MKIKFTKLESCKPCNATGIAKGQTLEKCKICKGSGMVRLFISLRRDNQGLDLHLWKHVEAAKELEV